VAGFVLDAWRWRGGVPWRRGDQWAVNPRRRGGASVRAEEGGRRKKQGWFRKFAKVQRVN